jgi:ParB-like chromosome segregation protein Spo0J
VKTRKFAIADLKPFDRNPRIGDVEQIKESLKHFGQFKTIVVNLGTHTGQPNVVLAGNHTLQAARELGWTELTATVVDVDADTAAKIVLADNRSSDRADYNDDMLLELLQSLPDLEGTGYDAVDIGDLLAELEETTRSSVSSASFSDKIVVPEEGEQKFSERAAWEDAARRLIVLDIPSAEYLGVIEKLEAVSRAMGTESNTETFLALLEAKAASL